MPHFAPPRPRAQQSFQNVQLFRSALRVYLNRAIVGVTHPTGQADFACMPLHEGTESHALYAPMHAIEPGNQWHFHSPRIAAMALHLP